jgi:OOP family OmpA-OmpF porin
MCEKTSRQCEAKRSTRASIVSAALGMALLAPAFAFAENAYIGAGVGQSSMQSPDNALLGGNVDDTDTAWKVYGGYLFNRHVGLELGYVDFGTFKSSSALTSDEWKAKAFDLSLLGVLPVGDQFSVFGKAGAAHWNVDDHFSVGGLSASPSADGNDWSYGVGAQYDFTRNVGGRLEWQRFKNVGDEDDTGRSDLDLFSMNVVYHFH